MHGINASVAGAATVDIQPAGLDPDVAGDTGLPKRLIFKVVSGTFTGDQIKVEVMDHKDGNTVAAPDGLSTDYDVVPSITGVSDIKDLLNPAASNDIDLNQYVIAADANESGDGAQDHFGLKITFDRANAAADLGMGAGLAIAWRVVGS